MTVPNADYISYVIVVRGMPEAALELFSARFPRHLGGVNPQLHETYHTINCDLSEISENLEWIVTNVPAQYTGITLSVSIRTTRHWSNYDVPTDVLAAAQRYAAGLRITFTSPIAS